MKPGFTHTVKQKKIIAPMKSVVKMGNQPSALMYGKTKIMLEKKVPPISVMKRMTWLKLRSTLIMGYLK